MPTIFHDFLQQLAQTSWLEWIATLSGLACVYLAAKQNIWNWPISIISVSLYLYIFYRSRIYGDSILQVYFLLTAIYGWYYWRKRDQSDEKPISSLSIRQQAIYFAIILALGASIGFCLDRWTDSDVPYIDGLCTSMSFIAQFLMTRKYVQSWAIWVAVDVLYIPLYLHKDLAMTAVLYFIFAVIAWNGYRDWRKTFLNTTWQK